MRDHLICQTIADIAPASSSDATLAVAPLIELLIAAETRFRSYEEQHRAKGTNDAAVKAAVNRDIADRIAQGLADYRGHLTNTNHTTRGNDTDLPIAVVTLDPVAPSASVPRPQDRSRLRDAIREVAAIT